MIDTRCQSQSDLTYSALLQRLFCDGLSEFSASGQDAPRFSQTAWKVSTETEWDLLLSQMIPLYI